MMHICENLKNYYIYIGKYPISTIMILIMHVSALSFGDNDGKEVFMIAEFVVGIKKRGILCLAVNK